MGGGGATRGNGKFMLLWVVCVCEGGFIVVGFMMKAWLDLIIVNEICLAAEKVVLGRPPRGEEKGLAGCPVDRGRLGFFLWVDVFSPWRIRGWISSSRNSCFLVVRKVRRLSWVRHNLLS